MNYNTAVIGFGYIGSVIGAVLANKGINVLGVDKNPYIIDCINNGKTPFSESNLEELIKNARLKGTLKVTDDYAKLSETNVFIITVGTPLNDDFSGDVSFIIEACTSIRPYVTDGSLIIIKSTVPPYTTSNIVAPIFKNMKVNIAFCPERLAEGKAISEFESIPIIVGGVDFESGLKAKEFWESVMNVETILVKSSVAAEMVKLADNLWIDLNIALAHEISFICDKMGIDAIDVISAANTLPKGMSNVNILTPSVGVGGYCLTKDPWFVDKLGKDYGLKLHLPANSRAINDSVPIYAAAKVDELMCRLFSELERENKKIAVLGIAFKNDTGDCRYSPTKYFIDKIEELGYEVEICDPLVLPHDANLITKKQLNNDIFDTIRNAHCIAFLTGHSVFKEICMKKVSDYATQGALVFDGRRYFNNTEIEEIYNLGMFYAGVGR